MIDGIDVKAVKDELDKIRKLAGQGPIDLHLRKVKQIQKKVFPQQPLDNR